MKSASARDDTQRDVKKKEQQRPPKPEFPFALEDDNEGREENIPAPKQEHSPIKPSKSGQSEPQTSVTAALTEAEESFSFEINLPPAADVSPLSCKESVIGMMLSRSVDRALDAPPPLEMVQTSPKLSRTRTRSKSRARSKSRRRGPSRMARSQEKPDDQHKIAARSQSKERTSRTKTSSASHSRSVSANPASRTTTVEDSARRRSRSRSTARTKEESGRRRSPSKQRVTMASIKEDVEQPRRERRRSPSKSRNRSKSRARKRGSSKAPSVGSDQASSSRRRERSRSRQRNPTLEEVDKPRTSHTADLQLSAILEVGGANESQSELELNQQASQSKTVPTLKPNPVDISPRHLARREKVSRRSTNASTTSSKGSRSTKDGNRDKQSSGGDGFVSIQPKMMAVTINIL